MTRTAVVLSSALLVATALLAGNAAAQSYQTSLPLDGAERRAVETRLSTILDLAPTDGISRFALPTGRRVSVRTYPMVQRPGAEPCRGYRIDLEGDDGRSAVDGYRCRRRDGRAWVIVEPETVLAQADGPLDLRARLRDDGYATEGAEQDGDRTSFGEAIGERLTNPFGRRQPRPDEAAGASDAPFENPFDSGGGRFEERRADEPLYPDDLDTAATEGAFPDEPGPLIAPGETAPVPRRAPAHVDGAVTDPALAVTNPAFGAPDEQRMRLREQVETALGSGAADPVGSEASADGEALPPIASEPLPDEPADDVAERGGAGVPAQAGPEVASDPAGSGTYDDATAAPDGSGADGGTSVLAVVGADDAREPRVIGTARDYVADAPFASDPRVLGGLRDLDYLARDGSPDDRAIQDAVDEFARDERFALPVSPATLADHLAAARERTAGLPRCAAGTVGADVCVAAR